MCIYPSIISALKISMFEGLELTFTNQNLLRSFRQQKKLNGRNLMRTLTVFMPFTRDCL